MQVGPSADWSTADNIKHMFVLTCLEKVITENCPKHSHVLFQDYVNSQEQIDIYQKLVNLQEELRKLQEAEKLLSNALSRRYSNAAL